MSINFEDNLERYLDHKAIFDVLGVHPMSITMLTPDKSAGERSIDLFFRQVKFAGIILRKLSELGIDFKIPMTDMNSDQVTAVTIFDGVILNQDNLERLKLSRNPLNE